MFIQHHYSLLFVLRVHLCSGDIDELVDIVSVYFVVLTNCEKLNKLIKKIRSLCFSYQPPHVRRKLRIQDMVQKYRFDMTEPEFYSHLFTSPLC